MLTFDLKRVISGLNEGGGNPRAAFIVDIFLTFTSQEKADL